MNGRLEVINADTKEVLESYKGAYAEMLTRYQQEVQAAQKLGWMLIGAVATAVYDLDTMGTTWQTFGNGYITLKLSR